MAIITRLSRLVRADLHAVLDLVEEPQVLLRQALREMEEELAAAQERIRRRQAEGERIDAALEKTRDTLERIDEELDLCFDSGKEDLARSLVRRKLETGRRRQVLEQKRDENQKTLAREIASVAENRDRLDAMRQQAELVMESPGSEDDGDEILRSADTVTGDEIEVAFLREQHKRQAQ